MEDKQQLQQDIDRLRRERDMARSQLAEHQSRNNTQRPSGKQCMGNHL